MNITESQANTSCCINICSKLSSINYSHGHKHDACMQGRGQALHNTLTTRSSIILSATRHT